MSAYRCPSTDTAGSERCSNTDKTNTPMYTVKHNINSSDSHIMTENQVTHIMIVHYLHGCLGHSRGQFEDHNSSQRTHHTDRWMYPEQLSITQHNIIIKY